MTQTPVRRGARSRLTAVGMALALLLTSIGLTAPAASASESTVPITSTTGPGGFAHPGIGVSADSLRTAQAQVAAGVEPWASYYDAMAMTNYASRTLTSANQGAGDGVPANDAFNSRDINSTFIPDSLGAYTQALMYVFTGDTVYRENALRIVRIWSQMDPAKTAQFPDSHIHTGVPLYRLVSAAEILRSTPSGTGTTGYDLAWSAADTASLTDNLIVPMTETILHDNTHYMNQHTFPIIGAMAGYIFTDNRARYDEAVEWFTMNATAPDPDINGALGAIFREVAKTDPANSYGRTFVQHQEMGRDQAHAGGDVHVLTTLARMVDVQGTKVDPKTGVPSTAKKAVTPYAFLRNRLLAGAEAYAAFMMGRDVPWVDLTGGDGHVSEWYRGRWSDTVNELYHVYRYDEGVKVEKEAPAIAEQFRQRDGALFYNGNSAEIGTVVGDGGLRSFWGGSDPGSEYWLSTPAAAAGETVPVPADAKLTFDAKGLAVDKRSTRVTEDGHSFLRMNPSREGATIAIRSLSYGPRTAYSPVAIRIRTTDTSTLQVRSRPGAAPYQTVTLPDTDGQWRYVSYDMATAAVPLWAMGDNNIAFYTVAGKGKKIDFDLVNLQAPTELTPPRFADGAATTRIAVQGAPFAVTLPAEDSGGGVSYRGEELPKGATIDANTGALTWTPKKNQAGEHQLVIQASDGSSDAGLAVTLAVAKNRAEAVTFAQAGFASDIAYTSESLAPYTDASSAATTAASNGSDTDFATAIEALRLATAQLQPLNPRRADGTLDYIALTSSSLDSGKLGALLDNDNSTFSGDLTTNSIRFDFGADYRVRADAFEVQARITFGNRSQGSNVYGSNDGTVWTKLTTSATTNTDALETLPVAAQYTDATFRFITLQVDDPGVPTDPNYPGIFSISEFHIRGDRIEAVNEVTTATITSSNAMPGRAVGGDTVTVAMTTAVAVSSVSATIEGAPATVAGSGTSWTASAALPTGGGFGRNVAFEINYRTPAGTAADPLAATTDGTTLYLSNETTLIPDIPGKALPVSLTGELEGSKSVHVTRMFDAVTTSFSDVGPVADKYYIVLDFAEGGAVALTRAELLVRQDAFGTDRASALHLEASNDLSTWTRITPDATGTRAWQNLPVSGATGQTPYRYLRLANNTWINIAELRLFGGYTAPPASAVRSANITSSNPTPKLAVPGDTVSLAFATTEPVTGVTATIDGRPAAATSSDGVTWRASAVIPGNATSGRLLPFRVEYVAASGSPGRPLTASTDGSSVYLTTDEALITDLAGRTETVMASGAPDPAKDVHVLRMLDRNAATFSDIGPVNGQFFTILDFGATTSARLSGAELLVRQDTFGTGRSAALHLEGSNDLTTWTRVTQNARATLAWQGLPMDNPSTSAQPYRYIRIIGGDWINIAELRLKGTVTVNG
ncbi:putative Ig domain-containing protein [Microbacteriaceae bacterium VKM Ac-2855]|nr:putative Ig domain-containing protein [Microbacteriaceae bacterium VKM Ac-2855]